MLYICINAILYIVIPYFMTLLLPPTNNKRLLNWAKKENVQNIFKSWFDMYGGNLSDEKFLKLSQITYKIHVKANLV